MERVTGWMNSIPSSLTTVVAGAIVVQCLVCEPHTTLLTLPMCTVVRGVSLVEKTNFFESRIDLH